MNDEAVVAGVVSAIQHHSTQMKFEKVSLEQWKKDVLQAKSSGQKAFLSNLQTMASLNKITVDNLLIDQYEALKLPVRGTKYSAGYDFFSPIDIGITVGEMITIPTGIKWNPGKNLDAFVSLVPRSSLGRDFKIREPNVISIIDADYYNNKSNEGHIFINLLNEGEAYCTIKAGEKFMQGIIQRYLITDDDNTTEVRTGGFGSTGK